MVVEMVPLKGGRWHIIPQLAVYTTYIPLIVLAFWGVICYLPPFRGARNNHWSYWLFHLSHSKSCLDVFGKKALSKSLECIDPLLKNTTSSRGSTPATFILKGCDSPTGQLLTLEEAKRAIFLGGGKRLGSWWFVVFFFGNSGGGWFGIQKEYPIQTGWVFDIKEWWVYRLLNLDPLFEVQDFVERIGNWRIWSYMYESPGLMKVVEW